MPGTKGPFARDAPVQSPREGPVNRKEEQNREKEDGRRETELVPTKEKTVAAGLAGTYGPFAREAPVMRADGSFDAIPLRKFDRLKDKKKIVRTETGLDAYAPGFDPDAPEPKEKLFGIF